MKSLWPVQEMCTDIDMSIREFLANIIHPMKKISYGDLYDRTINKENALKQAGYNVVSIWESD